MLHEFMTNVSTSHVAQIRTDFFNREESNTIFVFNLNFNTNILARVCSNSKRNRTQLLD